MNNRIIGIDVTRAISIIGMIIVNFKLVLGGQGTKWMENFAGFFDGKASATFVTLAGVGIALMTNSAIKNGDFTKLKKIKISILKRCFFLFILGLSYFLIWPADILHYYAIYMSILLLFINASNKILLLMTGFLILLFPILMSFFNYGEAWDFETLAYKDFWTPIGFIRNLFFNGFHPVIPWLAFMFLGLWFGRQDLMNEKFLKKTFVFSLILFVAMYVISYVSINILSEGKEQSKEVFNFFLGLEPMPPLPIYMLTGCSFSLMLISSCILLSSKYEANFLVQSLHKTGQLALTFYLAHVIIGMGVIEEINPSKMGKYPIDFTLPYAMFFGLLCVLFAVIWTKYKKSGPIEWVMRKLTD
jgi:uncharacterized membrane protein YeiB